MEKLILPRQTETAGLSHSKITAAALALAQTISSGVCAVLPNRASAAPAPASAPAASPPASGPTITSGPGRCPPCPRVKRRVPPAASRPTGQRRTADALAAARRTKTPEPAAPSPSEDQMPPFFETTLRVDSDLDQNSQYTAIIMGSAPLHINTGSSTHPRGLNLSIIRVHSSSQVKIVLSRGKPGETDALKYESESFEPFQDVRVGFTRTTPAARSTHAGPDTLRVRATVVSKQTSDSRRMFDAQVDPSNLPPDAVCQLENDTRRGLAALYCDVEWPNGTEEAFRTVVDTADAKLGRQQEIMLRRF